MRHCFLTTLVLQIGVLTASLFGQEATPHDATFSIAPARVARRDQLFSEAQQLAAKGKHELAANKGEATLALEYELFGRQSAEATETLQWLATEYLQALEVHKAVERSRQYHALCRSVYGEDSWQAVAATYFEDFVRRMSKVTPQRLAVMLALEDQFLQQSAAGEPVKATQNLKELAAHELEVLGEKHPYYANTLDHLASLYSTATDYQQALALNQQALKIRKGTLGETNPDYGFCLSNLARLYYKMGDFSTAEPLSRKASGVFKQTLGETHHAFASNLTLLALLCESRCNFNEAERLHRQVLQIDKDTLGEHHPEYAIALNNLGNHYSVRGDYVRAKPLLQRALELHPGNPVVLNNLAELHRNLGDLPSAESLHLEALEATNVVFGETHPEVATCLNNLGLVYYQKGDFARAAPLYQRALEIQEQALGEKHPNFAMILNNLAECYMCAGDYLQAEPRYCRALEIRKEVLGEKHVDYAQSLNNLGVLYGCMRDFDREETLYKRASQVYEDSVGRRHPDYALSLNNLAHLYASQGEHARAEPIYRKALEASRSHLGDSALVLSERQQLAMGQMFRYQLDNYIDLALAAKDYAGPLFEQVLAWKGATLVRQRGMRLAASDPTIADQFQKLQQVARQLGALAQTVPVQLDPQESWRERVRELTNQKEHLEAELSQQSAAFRAAQQEITFTQLLLALPADAVLVDYLEYGKKDRKLLAFVVRHADREADRVTLFDLGPVAPISAAIDTWRQTFGMSPEGKQAGRTLREKVWELLLGPIGDANTILVSTDGVLGRLPLGALPGKEPDTYLLEDHRLAMLPVPQLLPALINNLGQQQLSRELLLLGGVDYDVDQSGDQPRKKKAPRRPGDRAGTPGEDAMFEPLPGTRDEVAAIEKLYRDLFEVRSETLLSLSQGLATEARFRELAPQFRHLHLATHGFFASAEIPSAYSAEAMHAVGDRAMQLNRDRVVVGYNPGLLSGLALAGANRVPVEDEDDGLLHSQELAFLPLGGVDTAVLSACDTGMGQVAGGEGLLGVQRAFQVAGVRTTVASYWKVDDTVTRFLMSRFYENLWDRELPRLDALREAQLYVLNNPDKIRGANPPDGAANHRLSPKFWAAFTLSGDWR